MFNSEMMKSPDRHTDTRTQPFIVKDMLYVLESSGGRDIDDKACLPGHHDPGGQGRADVVTSEPHPVDHVPSVHWLRLPELLPGVGEDGVDPGVGVVHQQVQLPVLLTLDSLEQPLHITVHAVVHGDGDGVAAPVLDLPGAVLQVGRGPPRDVDSGPSLAQLQGDTPANPPGCPGH